MPSTDQCGSGSSPGDRTWCGSSGPLTWQDLVELLAREELGFNDFPKTNDRGFICASFFALVAQAKEIRSGHAFPLVPTQVQLWIRELRRLGRLVHDKPVFSWLDEPTQEFPSLPVFHCSECGESGWVGLADPATETQIGAKGVNGFQLDSEPSKIYRGWFGYKETRNPNIVVISPDNEANSADPSSSEEGGQFEKASQQEFGFKQWYMCPKSLVLRLEDGPCPLTNDPKRFKVKVNHETRLDKKHNTVGDQGCPNCQSTDVVFFIGSQSATLSSVAIDELFGSVLNNDPKLLAFTDSVQDASHRAGFFSSRTYQFTFRTALQHVIDDAGSGGVRLSDAVATHAAAEPGRFRTNSGHIPREKVSAVERGADELLRQAAMLGEQTGQWAAAMTQARGVEGIRVLVGLKALAAKHPIDALEKACEKALAHGAYRLRTIRQLLKHQDADRQTQFEFIDEHPVIRPLSDYSLTSLHEFRKERTHESCTS